MGDSPIHTLLITEQETDVDHIGRLLNTGEHQRFLIDWVTCEEEARLAIKTTHYDVFLLCCRPDNSAGERAGDWFCSVDGQFSPPLIILEHGDTPAREDSRSNWLADSIAFEHLRWSELSGPLLAKTIVSAIRHKANEVRLLKLAYYDPMTGLANRLLFRNKLQEHIARARRGGDRLALLMLDLDGFKQVNDQLGHDAGDEVLISMATRLRNAVRETDTVARLGGDEFGIIATQIHTPTDCGSLADGILNCCQLTIDVGDQPLNVSTSIGISLFPDDAGNPETLMRKADQALLHSKVTGRSNYHFADPSLDNQNRLTQQLHRDIGEAIARGQLALVVQPIVDLNDRSIQSLEVLVRWHHPQQGLLFPDQFIPIAEHNGSIHQIGAWILRRTCGLQRQWHRAGLPLIPMSINISPVQFEKSMLLDTLAELVEVDGVSPHHLQLELSEAALLECSELARDTLTEFHEQGVRIAIDHFGKNHCSLAQLKRMPIDAIKIDASLINNLNGDTDAKVIAEAIIQLCRAMDLSTVASGLENDHDLPYLSDIRCDQAQGYLLSRPMNGEDFPFWYRQYDRMTAMRPTPTNRTAQP